MGMKKDLTDEEKGAIMALAGEGKSVRYIAERVQWSKSAVHRLLCASNSERTPQRTGRKPKISKTQHRAIVQAASNGARTAREMRDGYNCDITVRLVQQILRNAPHMTYKKMLSGPRLTPAHMEARPKWAKDYSHWRTRWRRIVFFDENKFNLDGPDGFTYYWHDLRKEPQYFSKRQQGGGGVMIWAAMSYNGVSDLGVINGTIDSNKYCEMLAKCLLPFASMDCPTNCISQQDNASCHRSIFTKEFLSDSGVDVLPWPARSPDLKPIENLWGILARSVYNDNRQFGSKEELKQAINQAWNDISISTLQNLYDSMPKRCMDIIERKGRKIKY